MPAALPTAFFPSRQSPPLERKSLILDVDELTGQPRLTAAAAFGPESRNGLLCGGDPVNFVDPDGLVGIPGIIFGAISGGVGGALASYHQGGSWGNVALGGLTGAAVGGAVGAVTPWLSHAAGSAVVGSAIAGGLSSYGGQVAGNLIQNGPSWQNLTNVNPGMIAASTVAGGFAPAITRSIAGNLEGGVGHSVIRGIAETIAGGYGGTAEFLGGAAWNSLGDLLQGFVSSSWMQHSLGGSYSYQTSDGRIIVVGSGVTVRRPDGSPAHFNSNGNLVSGVGSGGIGNIPTPNLTSLGRGEWRTVIPWNIGGQPGEGEHPVPYHLF